jgi:GDPmannose 4,6-dehydratase
MKNAVVTGVTGQYGAYLTELLLNKGYAVFGTYRSSGTKDFWRIEELGIRNHANLRLLEFEATDLKACQSLLDVTSASEVYNLAGQSSAVTSLAEPISTAQANGMAALYLLEAIRLLSPSARFFQAGSSELFGQAQQAPQIESTPFCPTSPYGVAKLFAHWATVNYREAFGIFGTSGILFNHESPLRGSEFVTRKITNSFAKIRLGQQDFMELGNLDARRDWGYAKDYVSGMWTALQAEESDTFIFATNCVHTVRDFVTLAGNAAGFDLAWKGVQENEIGIDRKSGRTLVRVNPNFYRPMEIHQRIGNPEKAFRKFGWRPTTTLAQLCQIMVEADILRNARGSRLTDTTNLPAFERAN